MISELPSREQVKENASRTTKRKIHVVFDMTSALLMQTGGRVYAEELANALREQDQFRVTCISDAMPVRHGGIWNLWNGFRHLIWIQIVLPIRLLLLRADLLHASSQFAPIFSPCPVVLTLFDTFHLTQPSQRRNKLAPLYLRLFVAVSVWRADVICAISIDARKDIESAYRIPSGRIQITYLGVNPLYRPLSEARIAAIREKYALSRPFFVFVGTWTPRKNLPRLIEAFRIFRNETCVDYELILVGPRRPPTERNDVMELLQDPQIAQHVRSLGYVPDEDMPGIYAACEALVFPSLAEGFGLPVIEAMACGTPVLVSAVSCLPEVAGNAALFFDPEDPADIARTMKLILSPDIRRELSQKGLQRAQLFTWKNTALETEKAYIEALR